MLKSLIHQFSRKELTIFAVVFAVFLFLGVGMMAFAIQECGWKALFLGDGAFTAAMLGMCE